MTPDQKLALIDRRARLARAIGKFRKLQMYHTPTALRHAQDDGDQVAEKILLWLPSSLDEHSDGIKRYREGEKEVRIGQLRGALESIRTYLFVKARLMTLKKLHVRHQHASTRAQNVLARNDKRIAGYKSKYQAAWKALEMLIGDSPETMGWRKLVDSDVRTMDYRSDKGQKRQRGDVERDIEEGGDRGGARSMGESRHRVSWIWSNVAEGAEDSEAVREATRIEWSKAYARKTRWEEEVVLLEEEMRRVLVLLEYEANVWEKRGPRRAIDDITRGQRAYGHHQAAIRRRMAQKFVRLWENLDDVAPTTELVPAPTELEIGVEEEAEIF